MSTLAVIGCGPKAVALSVKAKVLRELGYETPEIVIVEKNEVAGNWTGRNGLTNGLVMLSDSSLKDLGFPYRSLFDPKADALMQQYSWVSYLIDTDNYTDWIDRGPTVAAHLEFARYQKWAVEKSGADVRLGAVTGIDVVDDKWRLDAAAEQDFQIEADGLVLTGPGDPRRLPLEGDVSNKDGIPQVLDVSNFWLYEEKFWGLKNANIAVVGGGESAAAIVVQLLNRVDLESTKIDLPSNGKATMYARNEHGFDNHWFSDPSDWHQLDLKERTRFMHSADSGTFSPFAKKAIDEHNINGWVSSKTVRLKYEKPLSITGGDDLRLKVQTHTGDLAERPYDYIIVAIGFDPLSILTKCASGLDFGDLASIENNIQRDMSLKGQTPKLYLPMLASLTQGVGFRNYTCLGLLADRILEPLVAHG